MAKQLTNTQKDAIILEVNTLEQERKDLNIKPLADAKTDADKEALALQRVEQSRQVAQDIVKGFDVEGQVQKVLSDLFIDKKVNAVLCLEKDGMHFNYKNTGYHLYVSKKNNLINNFLPCNEENLQTLKALSKEAGNGKFLRVISRNGKMSNIGSISQFKNLEQVFDHIAKYGKVTSSEIKVIPHYAKIAYILEQIASSTLKGAEMWAKLQTVEQAKEQAKEQSKK